MTAQESPKIINKYEVIGSCKHFSNKFDTDILLNEIRSISSDTLEENRGDVHADAMGIFIKGYTPTARKPDEDRPVLDNMPYLKDIIYNQIPGISAKCVIAFLKPNGKILMHRDGFLYDKIKDDRYMYNYFGSTIRFHIPVITNKQVKFFCHDGFFNMRPGELWAVNNTSDHAVLNDHNFLERIHIIIDQLPDKKLINFMDEGIKIEGYKDPDSLDRLLTDSLSPSISPYSQGKPNLHKIQSDL